MGFFVAIFLGLVQGFTEFLPISSSGHLLLVEEVLGVQTDTLLLNVLLHIATLFAVFSFYRKTLFYMIKNPWCRLNRYLLVATLPAVLFVLGFGLLLGDVFSSANYVGVGFIVSGLFLAIAQFMAKRNRSPTPLNWKGVIIMGFAQALAVFPGVSRSGTTFAFGVTAGMEKNTTLDFSFLMSIPIILASLVYELLFNHGVSGATDIHWASVLVAFAVAFVSALVGLKIMQKLVKKIGFWGFVPYLIVLGIILLIWL